MTRNSVKRTLAGVAVIALLAGCEDGAGITNPFAPKPDAGTTAEGSSNKSVRLVERDVEAPKVFQVNEKGLWDGRPSLGGVWVAHPDVKEPERVIIRNESNGKFVIGALFRRERETPGPRIEASSDAASALGMLAGSPVDMSVTALRREEVAESGVISDETADEIAAPADVTATTLDPIQSAAAAIDAPAPAAKPAATAAANPAPKPAAKPAPKPASSLSKPFIQLGIFSVEANAKGTAEQMRKNGIVPTVKKQTSKGKTFWRVIVGPATSSSERAALLKKVKASGFGDAYFVTD